ncbi:type II secretion system minor pseudopilin GspI [Marinimicrobium sp. ABcell2]|uniref:type II secretion system minor pseudopilin GspI n=1 Tax=Marinimicrobium sp. ABcell2 TaxID=3069751 RepID=UPI0027AFEA1A|nr:type II secretion system minor pseudopilin GspI [Marinimicrobium sp. ABcell2]MDQ2076658.1 type II secretion system minor pseudopilin GspI [Marinimicrobium sp. ABcell2]
MVNTQASKARGFTLIEVMVALVVVSVALPALVSLVMTQLDGTASIRERTQAYWVAENEMTRLQLQQRLLPDFTLPESANGELDLSDRVWYWRMDTEATEVDDIQRVEFFVYRNEDRESPVARLAGFIHDS